MVYSLHKDWAAVSEAGALAAWAWPFVQEPKVRQLQGVVEVV